MAKTAQRKPSPVIADRLGRCRREMRRHRIGALLVSNPMDYFYLTGFTGEDSAVLITPRVVHLISDRRFEASIERECSWATAGGSTKVWMRRGLLNEEIARVCRSLKLRSLAVQTDHLCVDEYNQIKKLARFRRLSGAPPILAEMRRIKQPAEITTIRKAVRVAEEAFDAMRATIRLGQTELEMAARLEYEMKRRGAARPSFPTICAEGGNAAHPHAHPGKRKVKRGSAILFDWGARVEGYCSDLTRMVFVGSMPRTIERIYRIVLEAQRRAIAAIRPGARMCDVDAIARAVIAETGYGDAFKHGLGHGLGLNVHEPPSLSWRSREKLEPGMVVTVEPGIYLPGVGGVRIEDDVLVTPTGCRILSRLSRKLDDAVIRLKR
ncbi:MAG: aminopeptidase P family protein [Planctomycetes bacterium]|nr:aminopeptidase P family protein [Planctomycetota bacterium]